MAYPWLEEKKQQARAQKAAMTNRNFGVTTISDRYMIPTGSGGDGVVQPSRPTDLYPTAAGPRMVHEGEGMIHNNDGSVTVVPQRQLMQMEKQYNVQGYQTGGTMPSTTLKPAGQTEVENKLPPLPSTKSEMPPMAPTAQPASVSNNLPSFAPPKREPTQIAPAMLKPAGQTQLAPAAPATPATPTLEDRARQTGMQGLMDIATGGSAATKATNQKYLDDLKATQAVESRVAGQQGAQAGLSKDVMSSRSAQLAAQQGAILGEAESSAAQSEIAARENALSQLASQGLSGQQFEQAKEQFKKTFGLSEAQFNEQVNQFNKTFGASEEQRGIANTQWQSQFNETVRQNDAGQSNWQKSFDAKLAESADAKAAQEYSLAIARGDTAAASAAWQRMYPGTTPDMSGINADIAGKKRDAMYSYVSKYAAIPGMTSKEAIDSMISNGQASESDRAMLTKIFDGSKTAANPITQLVSNLNDTSILSDDIVNGMFVNDPEMANKTIQEKRDYVTNTLVTTLIDPNGTLAKSETKRLEEKTAATTESEKAQQESWIAGGGSSWDDTNTYSDHKSMFAEGGGVWTGNAQAKSLSDGERVSLGNSFGIQNSNIVIPKGNYTAMKVKDSMYGADITLLKSEDGSKFFMTGSKVQAPNGVFVQNGAPIAGYTYNKDGGYYVKNSSSPEGSSTANRPEHRGR